MKTLVQKQAGFNLIELMVVVALIGVLGFVGLPSLQSFMQAQMVGIKSDSVTNAFRLARAEALSRVRSVSVEWNTSTTANVAKTGFDILPGHIAVYDTADPSDQLIKQFSYLDDSIFVNATDNNIRTLSPQGRINSAITFEFCKESGNTEDSYQVNVLVSGQVTSSRNTAACN